MSGFGCAWPDGNSDRDQTRQADLYSIFPPVAPPGQEAFYFAWKLVVPFEPLATPGIEFRLEGQYRLVKLTRIGHSQRSFTSIGIEFL